MPKNYDKFIDLACANYCRHLETHHIRLLSARLPPDRDKSYVQRKDGKIYVVICSTEGEPMFKYRIRKDGRLKAWGIVGSPIDDLARRLARDSRRYEPM
jgi:hypothetical protein